MGKVKWFFMWLVGYRKSTGPVYPALTYDEYMEQLRQASERVRAMKREDVADSLVKNDPEANKAWLDVFPVGTKIHDERDDRFPWVKINADTWGWSGISTITSTSKEMAEYDGKWIWVMSENEDRD